MPNGQDKKAQPQAQGTSDPMAEMQRMLARMMKKEEERDKKEEKRMQEEKVEREKMEAERLARILEEKFEREKKEAERLARKQEEKLEREQKEEEREIRIMRHIDTAIEGQREKIMVEVKEVQARVTLCEKTVDNVVEEVKEVRARVESADGKIQSIERGMKKITREGSTQMMERSYVYLGREDTMKKATYGGGPRENPMQFLKEMEDYIQEINPLMDEQDRLRMVERQIQDSAQTWWRAVKMDADGYKEFKTKFLEHFWGFQRQQAVRNKIENGRFDYKGNVGRSEYFCKIYNKARYLDPPMPDKYIIFKIMGHFGDRVQMASMGRDLKTVVEAVQFLTSVEAVDENNKERRMDGPIRWNQDVRRRMDGPPNRPTQHQDHRNKPSTSKDQGQHPKN